MDTISPARASFVARFGEADAIAIVDVEAHRDGAHVGTYRITVEEVAL